MRSTEWLFWESWKCSKKKYRKPSSVSLTCDFTVRGLHHGHLFKELSKVFFEKAISLVKRIYLFGEQNTCCFDRAPQEQLPKNKHSPEVVLQKSCCETFPNFNGKEPLMKSFLIEVATCDFLRRTLSQMFPYDFTKVL